jgi:plastocyanin
MKYSAALMLMGMLTGPAPKVHQVKLVHQGNQYRFEPSSLAAQSGDQVIFTLVSGGPHNIAFDAEQIADDRKAALAKDMPDQMAPLASRILKDGESYTVTLDGLKPGTYPYFCMPHAAMGMKGSITIR